MQFLRFRLFTAVRLPRVHVIRHFSQPCCDGETTTDYKLSTFPPAPGKHGKSYIDYALNESKRTGRGRKLEFKLESFVEPGYKTCWTSEMDERLLVIKLGHAEEKVSWTWVADQMGGGVTADQCNKRWHRYVRYMQQEGIKQGEWLDKELLEELATQQLVIKSHWSEHLKVITHERIDWTAIGKQLNRIPARCTDKWNLLQASKMKKGPFTADEDALIRQRVVEWGDKGNGLWVSLAKEMGRPGKHIQARWELFLSTDRYYVKDKLQKHKPLLRKKAPSLQWTPELDTKLTEAVGLYKKSGGWVRVAEHMGGGITARQCQHRWNMYLKYMQQEGTKQGEWSDEEVSFLEEMVPQHKREGKIVWKAIGKLLNRIPAACSNKWNNLQGSRMKKGPFTAEEDALIRQRVLEWGDKGNGLWVSLEKEIRRPATDIHRRWRRNVGHIINVKDAKPER